MRLSVLALSVLGCRPTEPPETTLSGTDGSTGSTYTVQCSGWFPDWISRAAPPSGTSTFRLAQGYPMGAPVITDEGDGPKVTGWNPPSPSTSAPWLSFDFTDPAERLGYLDALKTYALEDLVPHDFVPQNHSLAKRHWYHVPMMTSGNFPREARHGLTRERSLRASEQTWLSSNVGAFGIGLYNSLGGYTIGQVFSDPEPSNSEPTKGQFIDGALVMKILFAEYDPSAIVGSDPLANAPEWQIQDPTSTSNATFAVRLIQMDIAVKDPRSTDTGWVFATYVYDESLPAATAADRWYNLTPVGLQWGNDHDVTASGDPDLDESWINPSVPAPFNNHVGLHGRLNGPVDNPESACMSCHSTAQVRTDVSVPTSPGGYTRVSMVPSSCDDAHSQHWFRSIPGSEPFGQMNNDAAACASGATAPCYCDPQSPPLASPPMVALDYSLQLQRGLINGVALDHANPCIPLISEDNLPGSVEEALNELLSAGQTAEAEKAAPTRKGAQERKFQQAGKAESLPGWRELGMEPELEQPYPGR